MPGPGAVVAGGVILQAAGQIAGGLAERRARKKRRAAIQRALRELTPEQITAIEGALLPAIQGANQQVAAGAAEPLRQLGQTTGVNPAGAIGGLQQRQQLAGATGAFETAMQLAPIRAGVHVAQANAIQPNYNLANLLNFGGSALGNYALYRGLRG